MLYRKGWQNRSENLHSIIAGWNVFLAIRGLAFVALACLVASCSERSNPYKDLALSDYDSLRVGHYVVRSHKVYAEIEQLMLADKVVCQADRFIRNYYHDKGRFVWIGRFGVDQRADSLLDHIGKVEAMGFSPKRFSVEEIAADLQRMRTLQFDGHDNQASKVLGRLEYNLTRAYLRYVVGQRFGFVNPRTVYNRLDPHDGDTIRVSYRTLYDVKTESPDNHFYQMAFQKVRSDSVGAFMDEVEPSNPLYHRLKHMLHGDSARLYGRQLIMVNMERCRWRLSDEPYLHKRYVMVNIPSFHLVAKDEEETLTMRMVCGSLKTKTPLLVSALKRVDVNPQWIVPKSIVKSSIVHHAGSAPWFASHRYFIRERRTGKVVHVERVSRDMLLSGEYMVVQEGGAGNSLGRIIFRFDNNLSIYLHDTPNRTVFGRDERDISHGCVRLEKPFQLARFLLKEQSPEMFEKINYSINADVSVLGKDRQLLTEQQQEVLDTLNKKMLVGQVRIKPQVPVFVLYYTLYPHDGGGWDTFRDVYGFDAPIWQRISSFM